MALRLYDTMSQALVPFAPADGNTALMYTCGPTVHDRAHIGNLRTYLAEDLLHRQLEACGWSVRQVMNITDVDDKIISKAARAGKGLDEFTTPFVEAFFSDLVQLRILPATVYPRATGKIPEMISLISGLIDGGHAYAVDGSVYFRISSDPDYGRLSHLDGLGLRAGASGRVDADEYEVKEEVRDFVLWKGGSPGDLAVWPSPWGPGRPGWHLECSAMAMAELGSTLDVHCGGVDNIFPHHENEIAQSESFTGQVFSRHWFHAEHLVVEGGKMAKSLGNFVTLGELVERGHDPLAVRYHLLTGAHYRAKLHFHESDLAGAGEAVGRLAKFWNRCLAAGGAAAPGGAEPLSEASTRAHARFEAAMLEDLNLPVAMAALHDLAREGNRLMDAGTASAAGAASALEVLRQADTRLGVMEAAALAEPGALSPGEQDLLDQRAQARRDRDFALADELRRKLAEQGIQLEDTKSGTKWHRG